jgi:hypothetical protein
VESRKEKTAVCAGDIGKVACFESLHHISLSLFSKKKKISLSLSLSLLPAVSHRLFLSLDEVCLVVLFLFGQEREQNKIILNLTHTVVYIYISLVCSCNSLFLVTCVIDRKMLSEFRCSLYE